MRSGTKADIHYDGMKLENNIKATAVRDTDDGYAL